MAEEALDQPPDVAPSPATTTPPVPATPSALLCLRRVAFEHGLLPIPKSIFPEDTLAQILSQVKEKLAAAMADEALDQPPDAAPSPATATPPAPATPSALLRPWRVAFEHGLLPIPKLIFPEVTLAQKLSQVKEKLAASAPDGRVSGKFHRPRGKRNRETAHGDGNPSPRAAPEIGKRK